MNSKPQIALLSNICYDRNNYNVAAKSGTTIDNTRMTMIMEEMIFLVFLCMLNI